MQTKTTALLEEAAEALRENCYGKFEQYTQFSTIDRTDWSYGQKCRYGSESDYELAGKLVSLANELKEIV